MSQQKPKQPALSDVERHQRFKDMVRAVDADESPKAFDRAFASVITPPKPKD